jgi:hypothetical protein
MTIKDLNTKFQVSEFRHKGKRLLFEKEPATTGRSVHRYLCTIGRQGNRYFVDGFKPTDKLEVLEQQVKDHVTSLPYDSDYYCPTWRDGLFEEMIIHDYLGSIGFKSPTHSSDHETYELVDKNIYGFKSSDIVITIDGLWALNHFVDGKFVLPQEISVLLHTGDCSWMKVKSKRNVENIKRAIDSLLKPLYLTDSARNLKNATVLKNASDIEITMEKLTASYEIGSVDFKSTLKQQLEETLAKLV